ncbi:hypothetical protein BBP40_008449 [Aspergillus hancockii]|nr:hypothetical protein BBP40_008449 [Aspergillus hancockii]
MAHNILITGASGYLGGSLLARLAQANLPPYQKLYALVRTDEQGKAVKEHYGAGPIQIDLANETNTIKAIVDREITIIYYLIDALNSGVQKTMIRALGEVKRRTGKEVHFLHTSGAKIFSSHAGHPIDRPLWDTDPELYEIQKGAKASHPLIRTAIDTNIGVLDTADAHGVRSYIFVPCVVYGKGEGFGNPISIQTTAIVRAAKQVRRVYSVDPDDAAWPVCHISDNTALYLELLRNILRGSNPGYGKDGYYLAASGSVTWHDLCSAMAKALAARHIVEDETVALADDAALEAMGKGLDRSKEFVPVELGGYCTFAAKNGHKIGWQPQYPPENILDAADAEVDLILQHL